MDIRDHLVLCSPYTAGSYAFKLEKESLQKESDKLKTELYFRQGSESDTKFAELCQTCDTNVRALQRAQRDDDPCLEDHESQLNFSDDTASGQHGVLQKSSIAFFNETQAVASVYSKLLGVRM